MWRRGLLAGIFAAMTTAAAAGDCGLPGLPGCEVPLGRYSVALPETGTAPFPVLLHLHGAGGTGEKVVKGHVAKAALERGYAVLAPSGHHPNRPKYPKNWSVRAGGTEGEFRIDDTDLIRQSISDAVARFGLDPERILLSGFSRGGSMAWDIACHAPGLARAYAPVAGAFWDPMPEGCTHPVDLFHTHGWTDRVVPLEGRSLRGGAVVQGDVFQSLFILRATNGCTARQPESGPIEGNRWRRIWSDCAAGRIDLLLHPGPHGVPKWWADMALDWFEARLQESTSMAVEDKTCTASC